MRQINLSANTAHTIQVPVIHLNLLSDVKPRYQSFLDWIAMTWKIMAHAYQGWYYVCAHPKGEGDTL